MQILGKNVHLYEGRLRHKITRPEIVIQNILHLQVPSTVQLRGQLGREKVRMLSQQIRCHLGW